MAINEIEEAVHRHNVYRARHGARPLVLDSNLCAYAQNYAYQGVFEHDGQRPADQGENLGWGYDSASDAVDSFYREIRDYDFSNPRFSTDTGHFTQVVWRGTQCVGIGIGHAQGRRLYVFRYSPPGNWQGQCRENVRPAGCRSSSRRPADAVDPNRDDVLTAGQYLKSTNAAIRSNNGRYRLVQQSDSHLVLYNRDKPIWANQMWNRGVAKTIMQHDGNLVSYTCNGTAVWATGTDGHPGAYLVVQDDGNMVIYDRSNAAIWASNTWGQ